MTNKIDRFEGEYFFLSNFYESKVTVWGIEFLNAEAAFQSAKLADVSKRVGFANLNASLSKSKGRLVHLRHDWEIIKEDMMYEVVKEKFTQSEDLRRKLADTGHLELVEGNWWGDTYWGVSKGRGQNRLGIILMKLREEIK